MKDCLFCEFAQGNVSTHVIYEDEHVLAFLDINPVNRGHTLLIPKNHSRNILEINEEDGGHLMAALPNIAGAVKVGVQAVGINIHINNERAAGQVIFHTHIHIIPRFSDDGKTMWHGEAYTEGEAEKIRGSIVRSL